MEYVPGTDLKTILKEKVRLPVEESVRLMIQASAGIGYAHRAGLIHCDVKPHNMLVAPDQRLKVTDFGIARAMASIIPDEQHDIVWGSPLYFSPEQAAGAAPSPASDVYSLGVVMYEILTGRLPFYHKDPTELARMHREVEPVPPRRLNPEIPEALESIVLKVLSKEPSARYRTADQLSRVLTSYLDSDDLVLSRPSQSGSEGSQAELRTEPFVVDVPQSANTNSVDKETEEDTSLGIDWGTTALALLTIIAVGGLIPFWLWIWFAFNPPVP